MHYLFFSQLFVAIAHFDFWTVYFCEPLVAGFTTGAAIHVLFSQIPEILGKHGHSKGGSKNGPGYLFFVRRIIFLINILNF